MRTIMKVTIPVDAGNQAVRDGRIGAIMKRAMESLKPEAAYFYAENGKRHAMYVFDLKSPSDIPVVAEPFFMGLQADVQIYPCMNAEEVAAGIAKVGAGV